MQSTSDGYVVLRGSLALPVAPVLLVLDLETRGFRLSRDGEDILIQPFSKLTADDKQSLKMWKRHVLALLDYQAPEIA